MRYFEGRGDVGRLIEECLFAWENEESDLLMDWCMLCDKHLNREMGRGRGETERDVCVREKARRERTYTTNTNTNTSSNTRTSTKLAQILVNTNTNTNTYRSQCKAPRGF